MPPPPAEPFAPRIFLGPALRTQPDRRLVKLVREGYEAAFEEIVRRYRKPLDRFAAAFVGGRSEDVTQDAFSKALLALRGSEKEIELRPWLYRIVRNTALNDLRDQPRATEELGEMVAGDESAAVEAERREEIRELMARLRALPEPQRAALVMRELEGLSHEEIAAALGVSGGAARQAIHRARMALRDGLGMLVPLPFLRMLFDHGAEAAGAGAGGAAAAGAAAGGGGATLGGLGAAGAVKVGVATALLAGSVGAGVAIQHDRGRDAVPEPAAAEASVLGRGTSGAIASPDSGGPRPQSGPGDERGRGGPSSDDRGGARHDDEHGGDDHGQRGEEGPDGFGDSRGDHGGRGPSGHSGHGGSESGSRHSGSDDGLDDGHSGENALEGSHSGRHGPGGGPGSSGSSGNGDGGHSGSGGGGSGDDQLDGGGSDSGRSSGSSGNDRGSGGSGEPAAATTPPAAVEPPPVDLSDDASSGSGSGGDGSDSGSGGGGDRGDS